MSLRTQGTLLERETELGELESAVEDACRGAGRLLVIEGSAGIGKTRLLDEARRIADGAGMGILAARGTELEREFPFALVRQLFEPALVAVEPTAREGLLSGAAALAGPVVGVREAPAEAAITDLSFVTLNALYWLTSNLAEAEPLLLAVDDAHWSDLPSLRFFRFLATRLEDLPVLLALASRPAEPGAQPELLGQLVADPVTRAIRPRELSPAAVAELVREELGPHVQEDFCAACHEASGGNPYLLRELLVELAAEDSNGTDPTHVGEVAPETVRRAALLRLARLPDSASALARAVAVLGDEVELSDAAELVELDASTAREAADALALAGILEPVHPLRFAHPLVRTAVYVNIPASAKASAHEDAIKLLTARGAEPERIAVHLLVTDPAHDPASVETLSAAARRALARASPEAAAAYLRRALAEPAAADVRLALVRLLVHACFLAGDRRGFEELVDSGTFEELIDDPQSLLESTAEFAHLLHDWGGTEEIETLIERASAVAIEAGNHDLVTRCQGLLDYWTHLKPPEGLARLERFKEHIEADTPSERMFLALQAFWGLLAGTPRATVAELALRSVADGKIWRESVDNPVADAALYALRHAGELDSAERALAQQVSALGSRETWTTISHGFDRGELAFLRGRVAEAEAEARTPVEVSRQAQFPLAFPQFLALLVEVLVERGDLAGAEAELVASGAADTLPNDWWFGSLRFSRARLRLAEGKHREAIEELLTAGRIVAEAGLQRGHHPALSYLALALHAAGDRDAARGVAEQELAEAGAWGLSRRIGIALRASGLIEGGERGLDLLRESIEVLEPSPYRLEHGRSLAEYGAALRRANRRAEAREPLRGALEWARSTGALAVARRAYEELEATGEKLRPLLAEGVESLTPSERRVADLAAEGHTNREIAQMLFLSVKTVETHLSHVYRKLDIESRRELTGALAG